MLCAVTAYGLDNFTRRCITDLKTWDVRIILCDNAPMQSTEQLAHELGVEYVAPGRRPSLAASWNMLCSRAFDEGERSILILNNDTWSFSGMDVLQEAVRKGMDTYGMFFGMQIPERFYAPCPSWFSGFVMTDWCFAKVGVFDAAYWPCGWEDDDYMMRLAATGTRTALVRGFTFRHYSSPTSEIRDAAEKGQSDGRNQARFTDKWGLRRLDKESPDFSFPGMVEI